MASKKDLVKMERTLKVVCLDTTPCEKYVVTGSWDKSLILWKLSNGNRDSLLTFKAHKWSVHGVVVSSSSLFLYTCSEDKMAIKWSMKTGERLDTYRGHKSSVVSCCLTSDDKYFVTASRDNTVIVWNADDTTRLRTLKGHSSYVWSVSVSSDSRVIATGSYDNTVILWDFQTATPKTKESVMKKLNVFDERQRCKASNGDRDQGGFGRPLYCVKVTKKHVVTGGGAYGGYVRMWERGGARKCSRAFKGVIRKQILSIDTTPDETIAVTGSFDGTIVLWDTSNGEERRTLPTFKGHTGAVYAVSVTPNGDAIVSGSDDDTAMLWDLHSGDKIMTYVGHKGSVRSVVVSEDGSLLYTGSTDTTAIKWNVKTGKALLTFAGHDDYINAICLTPSGNKFLVTASDDKTAIIWNAEDAAPLRTLKGHSDEVLSVCVSPDAYFVATGSRDNTAILWEFKTAEPVCTFADHTGPVTAVSIADQELITASFDGTAIQYRLKNLPVRYALLHSGFEACVACCGLREGESRQDAEIRDHPLRKESGEESNKKGVKTRSSEDRSESVHAHETTPMPPPTPKTGRFQYKPPSIQSITKQDHSKSSAKASGATERKNTTAARTKTLDELFDESVQKVGDPSSRSIITSNSDKLIFYGLYKQAKKGDVVGSQPWSVQVEKRAKWDAWKKYEGMSSADAKRRYNLLDEFGTLRLNENLRPSTANTKANMFAEEYESQDLLNVASPRNVERPRRKAFLSSSSSSAKRSFFSPRQRFSLGGAAVASSSSASTGGGARRVLRTVEDFEMSSEESEGEEESNEEEMSSEASYEEYPEEDPAESVDEEEEIPTESEEDEEEIASVAPSSKGKAMRTPPVIPPPASSVAAIKTPHRGFSPSQKRLASATSSSSPAGYVRPCAARRDDLREEYRKQLKAVREDEKKFQADRKRRDHRRVLPTKYVVPGEKRRDNLRWGVRCRMLRDVVYDDDEEVPDRPEGTCRAVGEALGDVVLGIPVGLKFGTDVGAMLGAC
eukprot:g916.t1